MTANVPGIVHQFRIDAAGEPSFPYVSPAIKEILGIEAADTVASMPSISIATAALLSSRLFLRGSCGTGNRRIW